MPNDTLQQLPAGVFLPVKIPLTVAPNPVTPLAGELLLGGWSFLETTGAAVALIELWDGGAPGGETVAVIALAAGASADRTCPGLGLLIRSGLTINVLAGSIRGSAWLARA